MLNFQYKGISQGKYVEGEIEAINNSEAAFKLKEQKVIITKLIEAKKKKKVEKEKKKSAGFSFGKGVKAKDILIFAKQFSTMLRSGLPVLNALNLLIDQTSSPNMKIIIEKIKKDLEAGNALSKCFENHPKTFDTVTVNLIKAGEASGKLDVFLERIVMSLEKREKIKSQIKSALFYPSVLLTVAVSVTVFMLIKVVPIFTEMYEGMGVEIPGATAVIMSASAFLSGTGGFLSLIILIGALVGFNIGIKKSYQFRKAWHAFIFKIPLFGDLISKSLLARISLVMGNLNQAGVDILESLDIAKSVSTNTIVTESLENIKKGVFSGETLTALFAKEKIFPPTFSQLISVGEQTGSLDSMFASVAKYYEEEFDTAVSNLSSLIEPIMIAFMGLLIGGLMLALYSPIFNVGAIMGQ